MSRSFEGRDQRVGIVALVGEQSTWLDPVEKRPGLHDVGSLPRRERERDGVAERIDDGVDLGRQAAARAADSLVFAVFFEHRHCAGGNARWLRRA